MVYHQLKHALCHFNYLFLSRSYLTSCKVWKSNKPQLVCVSIHEMVEPFGQSQDSGSSKIDGYTTPGYCYYISGGLKFHLSICSGANVSKNQYDCVHLISISCSKPKDIFIQRLTCSIILANTLDIFCHRASLGYIASYTTRVSQPVTFIDVFIM